MKNTILILSILIGNINASMAEVKNYSLQKQSFSIEVPEGWKDAENFIGTPLVLFGPENKDGPRSVITFYPTSQEDKKHFLDGAKKSFGLYKTERENWLKGNFGEAISFDSYKEDKWVGVEKARHFGYQYEIPAGKFFERGIYITCAGNKVFYIKSIVPEQFASTDNALVDQTIKSLKCEKTPMKTAKN